jgi:hypothetical protein
LSNANTDIDQILVSIYEKRSVEFVLQTRGLAHVREVMAALEKAGYRVQQLQAED